MFCLELENMIETLRKQMEDKAVLFGLNHPEVYKLSCEVDKLHNMWEKERIRQYNYSSGKYSLTYNSDTEFYKKVV